MKILKKKRGAATASHKKRKRADSGDDSDSVNNMNNPIYVNGVEIDIEAITDQELLNLRKVLPRK